MLGSVIMVHGDDDGLVLPPVIAPYQAVVIPIVRDENAKKLNKYAEKIGKKLQKKGVRVLVDTTDARTADKIWKWIKRGVPLRIEVGMREMESETATITRRDIGKPSQKTIALDELFKTTPAMLSQIQSDMLAAVTLRNKTMIHSVADLAELSHALAGGKIGFFRLPYTATLAPEFDRLMDEYKITRRCLDDADPSFVFVAKSY